MDYIVKYEDFIKPYWTKVSVLIRQLWTRTKKLWVMQILWNFIPYRSATGIIIGDINATRNRNCRLRRFFLFLKAEIYKRFKKVMRKRASDLVSIKKIIVRIYLVYIQIFFTVYGPNVIFVTVRCWWKTLI